MSRRIVAIDALRGLAALGVVLSHVAFWTGASSIDLSGRLLARGEVGVAIFFAVSAYLLLTPWLGSNRHAVPDVPSWAMRRAARILPAYWLVLVFVVFVAALIGDAGGFRRVFANVFLIQGYTGSYYRSFTQTWSLTTEVTFYVLVPLIGAGLALGLNRVRGAGVLGMALAAASIAGVVAQAWGAAGSHPVLLTSVLGHLDWFAVGIVVAIGRGTSLWRLPRTSVPVLALAAALVYLVASTPIAGPVDLSADTPAQAGVREVLYAIIAMALLMAATSPDLASFDHPVARWLGNISYPLFLWHVLVLQVLYVTVHLPLFSGLFWPVLGIVLTVSVALSSLTYSFVEVPAQRWERSRRSSRVS